MLQHWDAAARGHLHHAAISSPLLSRQVQDKPHPARQGLVVCAPFGDGIANRYQKIRPHEKAPPVKDLRARAPRVR